MLLFHLREAVWFEALWKVALHYSYTLEVVHLLCSRPSGRSICKHSENVMFHTFHTEPAPPTVMYSINAAVILFYRSHDCGCVV